MDFHRRPGCPFQFLVRFSGSPLRIKHLKNSSHATSSAKSDQYSHTVQLKKRTIHTQKLAGSSPVVSTKKFLISQEIRNFSFASGSKSFLQIFYFFSDQYTDQFGDSFRRDTAPGEMILPSGVVFCCFMF